jgi:CubicO group peptidase (beta-lactamase class C family)
MNAQTAARQTTTPQTPSLPDAKPETIGLSTVRLQRMSDAFKREVDKGTLPGATVMVARRSQIGWFDAIGRQSPAAATPMTHDSIFRIFSMTKPIVSVGIMMLVRTATSSSTTRSQSSFRNLPSRRSASRTTASSTWYR